MSFHKKYKNISEIKTRKYQGYIWEADNDKPSVFNGDTEVDISKWKPNSYILEALLYCKEDNIAIHIHHNGKENIDEFKLSLLPKKASLVDVRYIPHLRGEKNVERVQFKQLWLPEKDPFCESMDVMKMKAIIFTGFEYENNQSN